MKPTYKKVKGKHLTVTDPSSEASVLQVCHTIGKYYFEEKEKNQKKK